MELTINEKLKEVFKDTSFESYSYEDFTSYDELMENLQDQISCDEIIYYSNAIEYLSENDASLNESINIAIDLGYTLENINSEILATILSQQNLKEELNNLENEIKECFEE